MASHGMTARPKQEKDEVGFLNESRLLVLAIGRVPCNCFVFCLELLRKVEDPESSAEKRQLISRAKSLTKSCLAWP